MNANELTRYQVTLDGHEVWDGIETNGAALLGRFDGPEGARGLLCDLGCDVCGFDADGNGSIVAIPVEWIGDGEPLTLSPRVMRLIGGEAWAV